MVLIQTSPGLRRPASGEPVALNPLNTAVVVTMRERHARGEGFAMSDGSSDTGSRVTEGSVLHSLPEVGSVTMQSWVHSIALNDVMLTAPPPSCLSCPRHVHVLFLLWDKNGKGVGASIFVL